MHAATRIEELLDLEVIDDLACLHTTRGNEAARELLELFAADAHRSLMRIRVSAWLDDATTLCREAHRLRGTSGSVGAARLEMECAALERCAGEGDLGALLGLEERIEHAFSVLRETCEAIRSPALFPKARRCSNMGAAT
jgi:HPt (histidine-containing phosphotransfer) domain-containing protein